MSARSSGGPIIPIILSGGSGTRLWPLSRRSKPKQFLRFASPHSLFQDTALRCRGGLFDPRPIVVGAADHRFLIAEDLLEIGVEADILLEPEARNSCAAIAAGCLQALKRDRNAMVLALAADHRIPDSEAFSAAVASAMPDGEAGALMTFGVRPDRPATAYGYVRPGEKLARAFRVEAFVEKPERADAIRHMRDGYLWNSGNFLFRADAFIAELDRLEPAVLEAVSAALSGARSDLDFLRLDEAAFARAPSISVDYAVMERTAHAAVLPVDYDWSDVGSWDAVGHAAAPDPDGNAVIGDGMVIDGRGNLVHSESHLTALIGVNDITVVATRDCLLVASRARAQDVKALVSRLREEGRTEAGEALQIFRPWGNYERLDIGEGYQVKRIVVKPGARLSLQKHRHRVEHWVVVQGRVEATIGETVHTLKADQSVYVPLGAVHRLANPGTEPAVLIEVQTGDYLGEDDIIRLEDSYNRVPEPSGELT